MEDWLKKIHEEATERRRNYKGPYCCLPMDAEISRENPLLHYNFKYREYGIKIYKTNRYLLMSYCVCCSKELPSSLQIKWAETLKKKYNLSDPIYRDRKKIPKKFLTDEWWKTSYTNKNQERNNDKKKKLFDTTKIYCCTNLYKELLNDGSLLNYCIIFREYGVKVPRSSTVMIMDYCLFCGTKFPISVRRSWFSILEQEYKLDSPEEENKKKVPKEFLTDEWWKQRGL